MDSVVSTRPIDMPLVLLSPYPSHLWLPLVTTVVCISPTIFILPSLSVLLLAHRVPCLAATLVS